MSRLPAGPLRGILLMSVSALFATLGNVCARIVLEDLHAFQAVFLRVVFGFLFIVPFVVRKRFQPLRTRRIKMLLARSVLQVVSMLMFFAGLGLSPLAKVTALNFTAPLFATVLAIVLFHEPARLSRLLALAIGFAGMLVIVQPGVVGFDLGSVLILGSSLLWACNMMIVKAISPTESGVTITLYTNLLSLPATFVAALFVWQTPTWEHLAWMGAAGSLASLRHLTFIQAFKEADVTAVLPVDYTKLLWAAFFGAALFHEVPAIWTWLGGTMIFGSVTYLALRERKEGGAPT